MLLCFYESEHNQNGQTVWCIINVLLQISQSFILMGVNWFLPDQLASK